MVKIKIQDRFSIVDKSIGRYAAFPTLMKRGSQVWLACRIGDNDSSQPHGRGGQVMMACADTNSLTTWRRYPVEFDCVSQSACEMDALLSGPFANDKCVLISREFRAGELSKSYISVFDAKMLDTVSENNGLRFKRIALDQCGAQVSACFGHIHEVQDGTWLLCAYGDAHNMGIASAQLYASYDEGQSWRHRGVVAQSVNGEKAFNEFSMAPTGDGKWRAVIRDNTEPFMLWSCVSNDEGNSWSNAEPMELCGHAPTLSRVKNRYLLLASRDLNENLPSFSIHMSMNDGVSWRHVKTLNTYTGGLYNGGYGDVIHVRDNLYLAAYYISDTDKSPWIESVLFNILE